MITTAASSSSAAAAAGSTQRPAVANPTTEPNDRMGKDAFLKLLVAQLKYQNPLSPMDGTEFIAQTAQLTMTEKLEELSKLSEATVLDANRRTAAELVGKTISYDNGTNIVDGVVTSARMNGGNPILMIGRTEVPLGSVLEVRATLSSSALAAAPAAGFGPAPATVPAVTAA
jgi:flagellar basal-body rod modification protein FlgD